VRSATQLENFLSDIDDDGYSYDDLVRMLGEANDYMHKEKEKFKTLKELYKNLQVSFEELKTSHNNLKENCEKLVDAQNSSIVHEVVCHTRFLEGKPNPNYVRARISNERTQQLHNWTSSHIAQIIT
jgi:archaellum component FlaC